MTFKNYPEERLSISSIFSRLNPEENAFREMILAYIIDNACPYDPHSPSEGINSDQSHRLVGQLAAKGVVVLDDNGRVIFAYPVSSMPTPHKVTLSDNRNFSAMCAIDAIGSAFTFNQDVRIDSCCAECGTPVQMEISHGRITGFSAADIHVLHVDLQNERNWAGSC